MGAQQRVPAPAMPGLDWGGTTRRRFLRGAAALTAFAGVGLGASGCRRGDERGSDGRVLRALSAAEAQTLAAVAAAVVPTQTGFPSAAQAQVVRRFDEELSFVAESIRADIRSALDVLEYLPPLYGRLSRFSALDVEGRREILARLCASGVELLRAIGSNLRILVQFFYFAHPQTWAAIGYDGPFGRLPEQDSEQRRWYAQQSPGAGT